MSGLALHTFLIALAAYYGTIPGVKRGLYPAVGHPAPGDLPAVVLFSSSTRGNSLVESNADGAMWSPEIMGQLLMPNQGDTGKDILAVDALITPIVDAFTINATGRNPAIDAIDSGGHIDQLLIDAYFTGGVSYAGQSYYGANLFHRIKWHRYPGA